VRGWVASTCGSCKLGLRVLSSSVGPAFLSLVLAFRGQVECVFFSVRSMFGKKRQREGVLGWVSREMVLFVGLRRLIEACSSSIVLLVFDF
jgi:hypothetical protein